MVLGVYVDRVDAKYRPVKEKSKTAEKNVIARNFSQENNNANECVKYIMLKQQRLVLLILSVSVFSFSGFAVASNELDDTEMLLFDDIPSVFSASKYEQKVTEAPARINIVTAKEIETYGYQNLADILRSVPGFYTSYDRNYSYTGVRGFGIPGDYDTRILTLVDGHRVNENVYDSLSTMRGFVLDVDLIERVEIVRGPASSLYGSNAFFGVVNVITKSGRDIQGTEISAAGGSYETYQGRISYGDKFSNGLEMLLSGTYYESAGQHELYYPEFDDPATNNGIAVNADDRIIPSFFAKLSHGGFTLTGAYAEVEKGIPTAPYETVFNDSRTGTRDERSYLDLSYQGILDSGTEVSGRVFYDYYDYSGDWVYDYSDAGDLSDLSLFTDEAQGEWWGAEAQVSKTLFEHHRFTLGAEYRNSVRQDLSEYDDFDVYMDSSTDNYTWGVFLQDEFQIKSNLILNLGVRYDEFDSAGSTVNPRAALIWSPLEATTLKLLYGSAYRAPNAYELYYHDGDVSQKAAGTLESETIDTYEFIVEQRLHSSLNLVASLYRNEIEDLITLDTDPADDLLVFVNQGDSKARGAELELYGNWSDGWSGSVSYTYQDAEDAMGVWLVNSPRNLAKLNVIAPLLSNKLSAGLEMQYESERKTITGNETSSFVVTNLTLFNQDWIDGLQASISVYNLFDETYSNPGSRAGPD